MKKITMLLAMTTLFVSSANSQIFSEDFSSGIPASWTIHDVDGLTCITAHSAFASWAATADERAASTSWYDNSGTGPTNDWLVSPAISLPMVGVTELHLFYDAASLWNDFKDEYNVLLSTTGTDPEDFDVVLAEIINEPAYLNTHSLNLTAYAGSTIHIAFQHVSDDEGLMFIDNVIVKEVFANDITFISSTTPSVVEAGDVTITGIVKNNGFETITSFDLDWNDGTAHIETIGATIAPGATYTFSHPVDLSAASGESFDIDICASIDDDGNEDDNCGEDYVSAVSSVVDKYVVGEEKTGTWCGWCPRGTVALEGMESVEKFIGIAVHNGDPMTLAPYDSGINTYVPGGYPGAGVDRVLTGDPGNFMDMFNTRKTHIPAASISVDYEVVGSNVEVTVTADFVAGLKGDYRLAAVVIENNVTGTGAGWPQVNYYAGGANGVMGGYESLANPVPAEDMVYQHVGRALGDNEILGASGSLPALVATGSSLSHTYTIALGADWNVDWLSYVGMLVDGNTGEIMNAGYLPTAKTSSIEEVALDFNVNVFPNPAINAANVQVSTQSDAAVSIEIYNLMGKKVYQTPASNVNAGTYYYTIDVTDFAAGIYNVVTTVNNSVSTTKLSVQ